MTETKWRLYETVAREILDLIAEEFGMDGFEGKQKIMGASGTKWEIDAKGVSEGGAKFIIVECKRHTTAKIPQDTAASLAWKIQDTSGSGGIIVSPLGFQEGAKKVSEAADIVEVKLGSEATPMDFLMEFLDKLIVGNSVRLSDENLMEVRQEVSDKFVMSDDFRIDVDEHVDGMK